MLMNGRRIISYKTRSGVRQLREEIGYFRLPRWLRDEGSACGAGDAGSTPGQERSSGKGNGNPLQRSCLEKSMGRGSWQATVHTMHGGLIDTSK